jgi:hypothetical protein
VDDSVLKHRKIARTLDVLTTYDFYDPVNEKPLRDVYLILYNAAYHHGTTVQINYKGKEEIAAILRVLGISHI